MAGSQGCWHLAGEGWGIPGLSQMCRNTGLGTGPAARVGDQSSSVLPLASSL